MAPYGSGLYGSGLYGATATAGSAIDLWRRIYGGSAPWLSQGGPPYRQRHWQLEQPGGAVIPGLTDGSELRVSHNGRLPAQYTLHLTLADPAGTYLETGPSAAVLAVGALVRVRCTVTTLAGSLNWVTPLLRITTGFSRTEDRWGRDVLTTTADEALRAAITAAVWDPAQGPLAFTPLAYANILSGAAANLPNPTVRDMLLGLYSVLAGGVGWTWSGGPVAPTAAALVPLTPSGPVLNASSPASPLFWNDNSAGTPPEYTWTQFLTMMQQVYGYRVTYTAAGLPLLGPADVRWDSSYCISSDPAVSGTYNPPWESVSRAIKQPRFTRVEVYGVNGRAGGLAVTWSGIAPAEGDLLRLTSAGYSDDGALTPDPAFEESLAATEAGLPFPDGVYATAIPLYQVPTALLGAETVQLRYWRPTVGYLGPTLLLDVVYVPGSAPAATATAGGITLTVASKALPASLGLAGSYSLREIAVTTSPLFPDSPPYGRTEVLRDSSSAQARLWDYLGDADQLAVAVDSGCELPAPGSDVRVALPQHGDHIDGWYEFAEAAIPLGANAATWTLKFKAPA